MKKGLNNFTMWIAGTTITGIVVVCLYSLRSFNGNNPDDLKSNYTDRQDQRKQESEILQSGKRTAIKSVRIGRDVSRVSGVKDDGDRFPDVKNLNQEPLSQSAFLQKLKKTDLKKATAKDLSCLLGEAVLAGDKTVVDSVSEYLVALGDKAVPDIMFLLDSGDKKVEAMAFSILSRIGTAKALVAMIGKMLAITDPQYRAELTKQFANIQTPAVTDTLVQMMNETDQPGLRSNIGSMLSSMEGGYVVSALIRAIAQSTSQAKAREMANILAGLGKPSNIPELESAISSSKNPFVQEAAAIALANIGNAQACEVLVKYADNPEVGSYCRDWLASVNSPYGQQTLLNVVKSDVDSEIRVSAAIALGNYTSSDLINNLQVLAVFEGDQQVKTAIQDSISTIENKIPPLPVETVMTGEVNKKPLVFERSQ